ncbi:MAG: cyclic-di-AMP receptor [Firmicutes bacterium]|jgi:uncharacterized protein YaaQ|nr:cyclic-di-AMP receptor [Bacillota bacterium]
MKLVFAIVHDEDSNILMDKLTEKSFGVTKLASTGGFLKSGNTTMIIGVKKELVDEVIDIIRSTCKTRKEMATPTPMLAEGAGFMAMPVEITVGGATIFVVDVEKYMKV